MTAAAVDPLGHVFPRLHRWLGAGRGVDDATVAVLHRFGSADEPAWLRGRSDAVRLDVLTVCEVLALRRG